MPKTLNIPQYIAHRGVPARVPENTIASLREAKRLGATWVEFDVMLTKDDIPIIMHDWRLDRTTNGKGKVSELIASKIAALDAGNGERVPTLTEWLKIAAELELGINVEIKSKSDKAALLAEKVFHALKVWPAHLPSPLVSSAHYPCLKAYKALDSHANLAFIVNRVPLDWRKKLAAINAVGIVINYQKITSNQVGKLKAAGYHILAYTVNNTIKAEQLFKMGVDSVFTDAIFDMPISL